MIEKQGGVGAREGGGIREDTQRGRTGTRGRGARGATVYAGQGKGWGPGAPVANCDPAGSPAREPTRACRDSDIYTPAYEARRPRASSQGQ